MNSTSNHNRYLRPIPFEQVVYYMNSTSNHNLAGDAYLSTGVVYYMNSTSNHNLQEMLSCVQVLYII